MVRLHPTDLQWLFWLKDASGTHLLLIALSIGRKCMWIKTVLGSHFGVGEFTTHFRTYSSGDWDVHWGGNRDFDSWPNMFGKR